MHELLSPDQLKGRVGKEVHLAGWVHDVRVLGGISFVLLRNSKGIVQIAAPKKSVPREVQEVVADLHQEDVITCTGVVKESKVARNGFEILPEKVTVVARASVPLPLDPRGVTPAALDTRLSWRTLDLRRREGTAVFKIENTLVSAMEAYLRENGFIRVFTPSIIGGTSEGGSEVFKIDYYGRPAFLRQDPQLHRQLTIAGGFDRVYDLGANWRAELSHTPRHISEHRTIAPEMAFIEDESDTMKIEEGMVAASMRAIVEGCVEELGTLGVKLDEPSRPFPVFQFPDVYKLLEGQGRRVPRGEDLDTESQRVLGEYAKKEFGSDFFFLNRFPSKIKPFYVMKVDDDPEWARSVDLVYKGVELSSGGQREHRHERILKQMREKGMDEASLKWFTDPFRYGVPPHGGYSFGIERFAAGLANLSSVKEAALFPRDPERLQP
ncbi:MAG: aspartate--tRNA(Asn) ligase [Thaumarchaeota archaeon]|nr:MAG: aspartate--tRNA(Asn) ligase [Nitrososphaerota archaeon]